ALPEVAAASASSSSLHLRQLAGTIQPDRELASELARALVDDPPPSMRDGGAIRAGYDQELDRIVEASRAAREWIAGLEAAERQRTGIRTLKVGYNRVFGYYIEVSHANQGLVPGHYVRKQTLTGGERYLTPELKEKEAVVLNAQQDRATREQQVLKALGERVTLGAPALLQTADSIGDLDALTAFADAADAFDWTRPEVSTGLRIAVTAGRHPVVEVSAGAGNFVPNDTLLDPHQDQIVVLTGPNMAGKSTYLRQ